jgi:uncharacterized membrane protein
MFGRNDARRAAEDAAGTLGVYADRLAHDGKLRDRLGAAVSHGVAASRRVQRQTGLAGTALRLAQDDDLREHLRKMIAEVENARKRLRRKRSHRMRNTMLVVAGSGAAVVAFVPQLRHRLLEAFGRASGALTGTGNTFATIEETIEVEVPVSTAYNQWTQFEQFPLFMDGVEDVRQLDDATLHWAATVAGKRGEWDARILEQRPDTRIVWESIDGRQTRGTVSFEKLGDDRTLIRLAMAYQPEGALETVGSAAGIDARRVRGDLERFKELIEGQGVEDGAWRGEIESGKKR